MFSMFSLAFGSAAGGRLVTRRLQLAATSSTIRSKNPWLLVIYFTVRNFSVKGLAVGIQAAGFFPLLYGTFYVTKFVEDVAVVLEMHSGCFSCLQRFFHYFPGLPVFFTHKQDPGISVQKGRVFWMIFYQCCRHLFGLLKILPALCKIITVIIENDRVGRVEGESLLIGLVRPI